MILTIILSILSYIKLLLHNYYNVLQYVTELSIPPNISLLLSEQSLLSRRINPNL